MLGDQGSNWVALPLWESDCSLWRQPLSCGAPKFKQEEAMRRFNTWMQCVLFGSVFLSKNTIHINTHILQLQFLGDSAASVADMHMFSVSVVAKGLPSFKIENVQFGFLRYFFCIPSGYHCHVCGLFAHFVAIDIGSMKCPAVHIMIMIRFGSE